MMLNEEAFFAAQNLKLVRPDGYDVDEKDDEGSRRRERDDDEDEEEEPTLKVEERDK